MSNYVAILIVQYLVSARCAPRAEFPKRRCFRALPGCRLSCRDTRACRHPARLAGDLLVWMLLRKTPLGYELIVSGFSPSAARYGGINVGIRLRARRFFAGGLGAWPEWSKCLARNIG